MLTGVPAFDRGTVPKTLFAIVNGEAPDLERTLPFRAPLLVQTLYRALAPKPELRLQSAGELAEALEASARLFGPRASKADVGRYVAELFHDVHDPLAEFFEDAEAETVHGFRPTEARPSELPPFPANGTDVSDLVRDPPAGGHDALEAAAESAYSSPPTKTQIVRGTPVAPASGELAALATPENTDQAVDDALSVLAWLQSQSQPQVPAAPPPGTPALRATVDAALARDDTRITRPAAPVLRPKRRGTLTFAAGVLAGALLTIAVQALRSEPPDFEPDDEEELVVEPVSPPPATSVMETVPPPPAPATTKPATTLDIVHPRGARARVDGRLLPDRVPILGVRLTPGDHTVKVWRGRYRRELRFEAKPGERYVMSKRLKKR